MCVCVCVCVCARAAQCTYLNKFSNFCLEHVVLNEHLPARTQMVFNLLEQQFSVAEVAQSFILFFNCTDLLEYYIKKYLHIFYLSNCMHN